MLGNNLGNFAHVSLVIRFWMLTNERCSRSVRVAMCCREASVTGEQDEMSRVFSRVRDLHIAFIPASVTL